jgi:hypothetical protein
MPKLRERFWKINALQVAAHFLTFADGDSHKVRACIVLGCTYGVKLWALRWAGATQCNNLYALKPLTFRVNKVSIKDISSHNINDVEV